MELLEHVRIDVVGVVIEAIGNPVLCVITCEAVALHPFVPVTVTL